MGKKESKKPVLLEEKKLALMGPDVVVIIPRKFIKYGILDPKKLYNISFEEVEKE